MSKQLSTNTAKYYQCLKTEVFHVACKSNFKGVLSFTIYVSPQSGAMFWIIASVKLNNNKDEITFQQMKLR
jgi:hypothetical protein